MPRLLAALDALEPAPSVDEITDALWLARFLPGDVDAPAAVKWRPDDVGQVGPFQTAKGNGPVEGTDAPARPSGPVEIAEPPGAATTGTPAPEDEPELGLGTASSLASIYLLRPNLAPAEGVTGRSPTAPALAGTLALSRALRPLRRRAEAAAADEVDETATAEFIADTGLWIPQLRHGPTSWLDVALVVDVSSSTVIWASMAAEIAQLLERQGAFRDIRVWRLDGDARGPEIVLRAGAAEKHGVPRSPRELLDPDGRRLVLVFSDCVGAAWEVGAVHQALELWGRAGPVAILQPLPQRMWERAGTRCVPARLRSPRPGAANRELTVEPRRLGGATPHRGVPIPVMELGPRWLAPWADLVSGEAEGWVDGTVLFTGDPPVPAVDGRVSRRIRTVVDPEDIIGPDAAGSPSDLLLRFRSTVSPIAFRLAAYLSAAPLSIPVIRLIQRVLLPDSRPAHLAEVFLSGLLVRVDGQPANLDPDEVEYDFAPGARALLLSHLSRPEALRVLHRVSEYVSARMGSGVDFPALLADPELAATQPLGRPFASVLTTVLRRLGGNYRSLAQRVESRQAVIPATESGDTPPAADLSGTGELVRPTAAPLVLDQTLTGEQPRVWKNVPPRNPNFIGRTELIERLETRLGGNLTAVVPQALHGLGGVGKTQLVVEYVYRHATNYDLVCWVAAEDLTQVRVTLAELAPELGIPASEDITQTRAAVLDALRRGKPYRRWLMVFDNADKPESLQEFFPAATGHILVTSRNQSWLNTAAGVEVDVFSREESLDLLARTGHIAADEADELAEQLGDLPLALEQAAALHRESGMPVAEYLRLLADRSREILSEQPTGNYPVSVAAAWQLAVDRLRAQSLPAVQLLQLCSFFGPEPIRLRWLEMLGSRAEVLPAPLSAVVQDEIQLRRAVRRLGDYALGRVDAQRNTLQVHRLVQQVVRDELELSEQQAFRRGVHEVLAAQNPGDPDDPRTWEQHARLSPHLVPCKAVDGNVHVRKVVLDQVRYRWRFGDYVGARALGELARGRWTETLGPDDVQTLLVSRHLANVLRSGGELTAAAQINRDTLERLRLQCGDDNEHTLHTANSVGADLRLSGDFAAALALDEDTLERATRVLDPDHPLILRINNNIGVDLRLLGDFGRARELDESLRESRLRLLGRYDDERLSTASNLARDLFGLGEYAAALEALEQILEFFRRSRGDSAAIVLEATRTYGVILRKLGRPRDARQLAERTLDHHQQRWGNRHPYTLAMMTTFCNDLRTVGDYARARDVGEEALTGYQEVLGAGHPFTMVAAGNLAIVLRRLVNQLDRAHELDEESLRGLRASLGDDHPYTLCAALNLGNDHALAGDHERARELSMDTLERSRRVRGEDHPYTLASAINLAQDLRAVDRADEASKLADDTVKVLRRVLGPQHPDTVAAAQGQRAESDIEPPQP